MIETNSLELALESRANEAEIATRRGPVDGLDWLPGRNWILKSQKTLSLQTRAVHAGEPERRPGAPITTPVYHSSMFLTGRARPLRRHQVHAVEQHAEPRGRRAQARRPRGRRGRPRHRDRHVRDHVGALRRARQGRAPDRAEQPVRRHAVVRHARLPGPRPRAARSWTRRAPTAGRPRCARRRRRSTSSP